MVESIEEIEEKGKSASWVERFLASYYWYVAVFALLAISFFAFGKYYVIVASKEPVKVFYAKEN